MFLKNAWYIAAEPAEMEAGIISRTLLNEALAIFRTESGMLAAVEDRCPHRLVPLSIGRVVGETLQCGYHGAAFNTSGQCVRIPGQDKVPSTVCVRSYPVVEKHGYIWVWMGDPALSNDQSSIPDGYWPSGSSEWYGGYGLIPSLKTDYRLLNDNVIDITHAEFVHPDTLGGEEGQLFRKARRSDEYMEGGITFSIRDRSIQFRMKFSNVGKDSSALIRQMVADSKGLENYEDDIELRLEVDWWSPCHTRFMIGARPSNEPDAPLSQMCNLHSGTPETETTTHYFYRSMRNTGNPANAAIVQQMADYIFGQDKPVLEAQQRKIGNNDLFDLNPISFAGDRLPMEARRILSKMIGEQALVNEPQLVNSI